MGNLDSPSAIQGRAKFELSAEPSRLFGIISSPNSSEEQRTASLKELWKLQAEQPSLFSKWANLKEFKSVEINYFLRSGDFDSAGKKVNELLQAGVNYKEERDAINTAKKALEKGIYKHQSEFTKYTPEVDASSSNSSLFLNALGKTVKPDDSAALRALRGEFATDLAVSGSVKSVDQISSSKMAMRLTTDLPFHSSLLQIPVVTLVQQNPEKAQRIFAESLNEFGKLSPTAQREQTSIVTSAFINYLVSDVGRNGLVERSSAVRDTVGKLAIEGKLDPEASSSIQGQLLLQEILGGGKEFKSPEVQSRLEKLRLLSGVDASSKEWTTYTSVLEKQHSQSRTNQNLSDIASYVEVGASLFNALGAMAGLGAGATARRSQANSSLPKITISPVKLSNGVSGEKATTITLGDKPTNVVSGERFREHQARAQNTDSPSVKPATVLTMPSRPTSTPNPKLQEMPLRQQMPIAVGQAPGAEQPRSIGTPGSTGPRIVSMNGQSTNSSTPTTGSATPTISPGSGRDLGHGPAVIPRRPAIVPATGGNSNLLKFENELLGHPRGDALRVKVETMVKEEFASSGSKILNMPASDLPVALERVKARKTLGLEATNNSSLKPHQSDALDVDLKLAKLEEKLISGRMAESQLPTVLGKQSMQDIKLQGEIKLKIENSFKSYTSTLSNADFLKLQRELSGKKHSTEQKSKNETGTGKIETTAQLEVLKWRLETMQERTSQLLGEN
jgi:hypothetical protein